MKLLKTAFYVGFFGLIALNIHATEKIIVETGKPVELPGKAAKFDFMEADGDRILAAHKGTGTLTVFDTPNNKHLAEIPVGEVQGVAIDVKEHQYLLGNEGDKKVVVVDAATLKQVGEIKVEGPVDAVAFDSKRRMLYADEDNGKRVWVIDIPNRKVIDTVSIPGDPEVIAYDVTTDHLYQNIKTNDSVLRIDPVSHKVDATWSTLPATSPHGLAIDSKRGRIYVGGGNGKLVALDIQSGKVTSSADISKGVDQIAYNSSKHLIYCACKGFISIVKVDETGGLQLVGHTPSPKGAHTIAVASNNDVWVAFSNEKHSYLQRFK